MLQPRLGQPDIPASPQAEELQGLGQRALDPGACPVALAPVLRFLLAAGFLERLMFDARPEEVRLRGLALAWSRSPAVSASYPRAIGPGRSGASRSTFRRYITPSTATIKIVTKST